MNHDEKLTLLIVDDNVDAAITLKRLLLLYGHDAHVSFTGAEGVETARRIRPDVLLLDIGMPGCDGFEVAHQLRSSPGLQKLVIVAVTGWVGFEMQERAEQNGFDLFLAKPVNPERLQTLLNQFRIDCRDSRPNGAARNSRQVS